MQECIYTIPNPELYSYDKSIFFQEGEFSIINEQKMRILQINAVYATKSTGRSCKELHDWAVAHGHEVLTIYGNGPKANVPETEAIYLGCMLEHKLHALTGRLAGDAGVGSWISTHRLLKIIRYYKPDIVHLRNLHGNYVHIPMLLRFLAKEDIPTMVHNHDCFWFTGGCMHYTVNGCDGWRKDCSNCIHLKRGKNYIITNRAKKALCRKRDLLGSIPRLAAMGVSKWTADQAQRSTVLGNAPISDYIYNWINLDIFQPQGIEKDMATRKLLGIKKNDTMVLGVASHWSLNKGLDHFIRLRAILPETTRICLVGSIDPCVILPNGIMALGTTESTTHLSNLYSAADVFVHLSMEETFGKVTAEALACGTPAVVYNSTASPELVNEETGVAVELGDFEAVATAIQRLATIHASKNCRQRAERFFNLDDNCARQIELYEKTINLK